MNEMLHPDVLTTRRLPWRATITLKFLLEHEDREYSADEMTALGRQVAEIVRGYSLLSEATLVADFEQVTDVETFNELMDTLYDACDCALVWVK